MKKILLLLVVCLLCVGAHAQTESQDSVHFTTIDKAFEACIALRDAAAKNDKQAMQVAADSLRSANTSDFGRLRCEDTSSVSVSIDGHLFFDEAFVDSLAVGVDAYRRAALIQTSRTNRGQTSDGSVLTKTCFVKAGQSTVYSFTSSGYQELAVVPESGGLVTLRIHVSNRNGLSENHNDTVDVKKGRSYRKTVFKLPENQRSIVRLEVINCGKKDISFVVISN